MTQYGFEPITERRAKDLANVCMTLSVGVRPISHTKDGRETFSKRAVKRFKGKPQDWERINTAARLFCDRLNSYASEEDQGRSLARETFTEIVR